MVPGWVTGAATDLQGKDGKKHRVYSALNCTQIRYFGPLLRIQVVSSLVTGAVPDVLEKDGEKHHVHSALNPSFTTGSTVGSR